MRIFLNRLYTTLSKAAAGACSFFYNNKSINFFLRRFKIFYTGGQVQLRMRVPM
jgi:hypothetical protein